jgi:hypothetical protein
VYKLDFKNFTNIITAPKNIGHNKWVLFSHNNIKQSDDYMSAIQLRKQTKLVKEYWSEVCGKEELVNNPMNSSFYESINQTAKTRYNNAALNSIGEIYLNQKSLTVNVPAVSESLQPLHVGYDINLSVRLARSLSVKEGRLASLIKNNLTNEESVGAAT